ncbi:MAG: hypothetical protein IJ837_00425 [Clostridia bacterium]|nr:hypothetical protein [Clostridia bacterium]
MKTNLIALKTQETEIDFNLKIERFLTHKFAENGVEITQTTTLKNFEELNENIAHLLTNCSVVCFDLNLSNANMLLNKIDEFYFVESQNFEYGKYWINEKDNKYCFLFDLSSLSFLENFDDKILYKTFVKNKNLTFIKTCGLDESEVQKAMRAINRPLGVDFIVVSEFLDCEIVILADSLDKEFNSYIQKIYEILDKYIYSDTKQTLVEKLSEITTIRNVKLSFCDFLTDGVFEQFLKESMADYSQKVLSFYNVSKKEDINKFLNLNSDCLKLGNNTDEFIYETAVAMLKNNNSDVCVVIAGDINKACIAIGDNEAIHLYKYSFNHSKNFVDNVLFKTTIFKLLKKLKKNTGLF